MSLEKKRAWAKQKVLNNFKNDRHNSACVRQLKFIDTMADANIPVAYWFKKSDTLTTIKLKEIVEQYEQNIENAFDEGLSVCFAGNQGIGKTMAAVCILKTALRKNFSGYYTTASDVMHGLTKNNSDFKNIINEIDFLIMDEIDSRFFPSMAQKELFSSLYENIFRHRSQNLLPSILCTNETDEFLNVFVGQSIQAIRSLNSEYLTIYPIASIDYRKALSDGTR